MTQQKEETIPLVRIVDDNLDALESLSFLLQSEGYEVMTYTSAEEFLREDRPSRPGCLILDVRMPETSGLELQYILNARRIWIPIIFLTAHGNVDMAVEAIQEGAFDFQQKPVNLARMLSSVSRAILADLKRRGLSTSAKEKSKLSLLGLLTQRERMVLELASQGFTSREIGEKLGISRRTAEHYRADGLRKLNIKTASELTFLFELEKVALV